MVACNYNGYSIKQLKKALKNLQSTNGDLVGCVHNYNTRLASRSSYSLPCIRTNYGKFNIRYSGTKVWNDIDDETKKLKPSHFKKKLKKNLLLQYNE